MSDSQATEERSLHDRLIYPSSVAELSQARDDAWAEIERLEREKAEWSGIAAQRNRTNALLADERDCAVEEVKRLTVILESLKWPGVPTVDVGDGHG